MVVKSQISDRVKEASRDLMLGKIDFGAFERELKELKDDPKTTTHDRAQIETALGVALDGLGRYADAALHHKQAFELIYPEMMFDGEGAEVLVRISNSLFHQAKNMVPGEERTILFGKATRVADNALAMMGKEVPCFEGLTHTIIRGGDELK